MAKKKPLIDVAPDCEARARAFMDWYGLNADRLRHYVHEYDEDLFSDAFLRAYEAIARHCTVVKDYTGYFLRTYRATFLDAKKAPDTKRADESMVERLTQSDFNSALYENITDSLNAEVLEYVRDSYDEISVSLFEIYVGLAPEMSYRRIAEMLGLSRHFVRYRILPIKQGVIKRFGARKDYLLSMVDENPHNSSL